MRCAFVVCALALASNTLAFLPLPSSTPILSLRSGASSSRSRASVSVRKDGMSMVAVAPNSAFEQNFLAEASTLSMGSKAYVQSMNKLFPGAIAEEKFIECMSSVCFEKGFNTTNSINLVSTCRDEICRPFAEQLDSLWGESFNIASLAGLFLMSSYTYDMCGGHSPTPGPTLRTVCVSDCMHAYACACLCVRMCMSCVYCLS